jgi:hypothetical protein
MLRYNASPRGPNRLQYRFLALPIDLLNDDRLEAIDIRTFGVMLDASRDAICKISEIRLGERIFRKVDAARRSLRRLEAAGWIATVQDVNGHCHVYRLLSPSADTGGPLMTPCADAARPLQESVKSPSVAASLSRRISRVIPRDEKQENDNEERDKRDRGAIMAILAEAHKDIGNQDQAAERREHHADWLLQGWEMPFERRRLLGHLMSIVADAGLAGKTLSEKVMMADQLTRRGEDPVLEVG